MRQQIQFTQAEISKLQTLNKLAQSHTFAPEDLDISQQVRRDLLWAPPEITICYYLPSYNLLSDAQKLRYNQIYAVGLAEFFIWFEEIFAGSSLGRAMKHTSMPKEIVEAAINLELEESRHILMFHRLIQHAEPSWYYPPKRRFVTHSLASRTFLQLILTFARSFVAWVPAAILFEERTLKIAKRYIDHNRDNPGTIDPHFVQAHRLHLIDESRHFQFDTYLMKAIFEAASPRMRRTAVKMFIGLMKQFIAPRKTAVKVIHQLGIEFPELQTEIIPALINELPTLESNEAFQKSRFGSESAGRTFKLLKQYPEFNNLWPLFDNVNLEES